MIDIDDVVAVPFRYDGGTLAVPTGPGLGVALDEQKLARQRYAGA